MILAAERPELHVSSSGELREWLAVNHDSSNGVWLVVHKKSSGGPYVAWGEIVDELLAYGWVDSVQQRFDDDRSKLQITPRKPRSNWSRINKEKIERLTAEGRMAPAGLAMVELAKETGTWTALDAVERLEEPAEPAGRARRRAGRPQVLGRVPALHQASDPRVDHHGQTGGDPVEPGRRDRRAGGREPAGQRLAAPEGERQRKPT